MLYEEDKGYLLLAISLTLFTFVLFFFGLEISKFYFIPGFLFMFSAIWYWIKLKKSNQETL